MLFIVWWNYCINWLTVLCFPIPFFSINDLNKVHALLSKKFHSEFTFLKIDEQNVFCLKQLDQYCNPHGDHIWSLESQETNLLKKQYCLFQISSFLKKAVSKVHNFTNVLSEYIIHHCGGNDFSSRSKNNCLLIFLIQAFHV